MATIELPLTRTGDLQTRLEALGVAKREQANVVLFRRGEHPIGAYVIHSGAVEVDLRIGLADGPGRIVGPGSIVGLPATVSGQPYSLTATTRELCELTFIPRQEVLELLRSDTEIAMHLLETLANEIYRLREAFPLGPWVQ